MTHTLLRIAMAIGVMTTLLTAPPARAILADNLKLSKQETTSLMRVQQHLNASKTVRARFLQISSNGEYAEGEIFLQRPGRLRLVYDAPNPLMVVADGKHISFIDRKIETATTLFLSMTPADLVLRESIGFFGKDIIVTSVSQSPGVIRVGLLNAEEPDAGSIELVFSDQPVELRKWTVIDSQGIKTSVSLLGPSFDVPLNPELFKWAPSPDKPRVFGDD
ncbi:MAG: outer membrane lipoprotein carrier protein LolA [Rhodospirillales bacterium]|nr:outer membrane lipoprotein carrier protein LolA [Rhodospirillales bacterium]